MSVVALLLVSFLSHLAHKTNKTKKHKLYIMTLNNDRHRGFLHNSCWFFTSVSVDVEIKHTSQNVLIVNICCELNLFSLELCI